MNVDNRVGTLIIMILIIPAMGAVDVPDDQSLGYEVPVPGDLNRDCQVTMQDVSLMAEQWLRQGGSADLVEDHYVELNDFAVLSEHWRYAGGYDCNECESWQSRHREWIFCDDFETDKPLIGKGRYFEYGNDNGDFVVVDGVGVDQSRAMRTIFQPGEVGAGGLKLGFGRVPSGYFDKGIRRTEDFRDIYYRVYLKNQAGWEGSPAKLSRATVFAGSDWSQAMIAHLWSSGDRLLVDPASGVDESGQVVTTKYNDFDRLRWLGYQRGITPIFDKDHDDTWFCIEAHVRLNDPGQANGIQEFWINGQLEARREGLDFVGSYTDFGINAIFLENYWNKGSVKTQERFFDNFVVSTERIGCLCEND
jgi:hypothetical protein